MRNSAVLLVDFVSLEGPMVNDRETDITPAKSSVPDADDTSRSIYIRNLLGKPTTAERLVEIFEGPDHFLTYMMERHPSVTTNCNALTAILESPDSTSYAPQIEKLVKYICASWCSPDLVFADKWVSGILGVQTCLAVVG